MVDSTQVSRLVTYDIPDSFILDAVIDPAGYGIGYWATAAEIDEVTRTYTVTEEEPDEGEGVYVLTFDQIAHALVDVALGNSDAGVGDYSQWAMEGLTELQAGEQFPGGSIDSLTADVIIQHAIFGELKYG
jgi:hypothetical protein